MKVSGSVDYKRKVAKIPKYVIADDYSNVKIVLSDGVKYTMRNNGYVWDTSSGSWIPFYKILFDI